MSLRKTLEQYEGPVSVDFQREYHVRLLDVVTERTTEEFWDLVTWLPYGSALSSSIQAKGDPKRAFELFGWDRSAETNLSLVQLLQEGNWILAQSHSAKKLPPPKFVSGPLDKIRNAKRGGPDDANAMARRLLALQG